jgi:deoxyadenosine/deoxycytidine kinase
MKLLQRFIENTENWAVNFKIFIILHRCMQDQDLAQAVAQELSEKSDILTHYKKKPSDNTYGKLSKVAHFLR